MAEELSVTESPRLLVSNADSRPSSTASLTGHGLLEKKTKSFKSDLCLLKITTLLNFFIRVTMKLTGE